MLIKEPCHSHGHIFTIDILTPEVKWICYKKLWINNLYDEVKYQWVQQIKPFYSAILWHFILRQLVTKSNGQTKVAQNWALVLHHCGWYWRSFKEKLNTLVALRKDTYFERLLGHGSENWSAGAPLVLKHSLISWMRKQSIKNYVTSQDLTVSDGAKIKMRDLIPRSSFVHPAISYSLTTGSDLIKRTLVLLPSNMNSEKVVSSKHED